MLILGIFLGCGKETIPPEFKDKIVYVCGEGICTINPDGTERKVIVPIEKGGPFSNVRWSPNKRKVAFNGKVNKNNRVMVVNSNGSDLKVFGLPEPKKKKKKSDVPRVSWGEYSLNFCEWSPSGEYFRYRSSGELDGNYIEVMNLDGERITEIYGYNGSFIDDSIIVFFEPYISKKTTHGTMIIKYNFISGQKEELVREEGALYYCLACSPQSRRIAYGYDWSAAKSPLWTMQLDGSNKRKLVSEHDQIEGGQFKKIAFSPAGEKILFLPDNGSKSRIYVINVDGTGLYSVTDDFVNAVGGADWSPDEEHIIFTSNKGGNEELYIIKADGTDLKRLTNNEIKDCCPDW